MSYETKKGIKIFYGVTNDVRDEYKTRISKIKTEEKLFKALEASTLTAEGAFKDLKFDEKELIEKLAKPTGKNIILIGCNYGEKFNDEEFKDYIESKKKQDIVKTRKSQNPRKPKRQPKKVVKKAISGNSSYFTSQITFEIFDTENAHVYKIKLFRDGGFGVPGVQQPSMEDLIKPISILQEYLSENLHRHIEIDYFRPQMRNYKTSISNPKLHINLEKTAELVRKEKYNPDYNKYLNYLLIDFDEDDRAQIIKYLDNWNPMRIAEITYNTEKHLQLIIKFHRPNENKVIKKKDKKLTVKITSKGKINFDSGSCEEEVLEIYYWLQNLLKANEKLLLVDIDTINNDEEHESGESIYGDI